MNQHLRPLFQVGILLIISVMVVEPRLDLGFGLTRPLLSVWPTLSFHGVGTTFRVSINLTNVEGLVAYQIALHYNTVILDATTASLNGTWIDTERPQGYEVETAEVNDGLGEVLFEVFLVSGDPLRGSGVLLFVDFQVAVDGSTVLDLDESQNYLVNSNFESIPHDSLDGLFTTLGPGLTLPQPFFAYTPGNPFIGDFVFFDASGSFSPNGELRFFSWNFGDGTSLSTTQTFTEHVFQNAVGQPLSGTFTVSLEVTDVIGLRNSTSRLVTVSPLSAGRPPIAFFTQTPRDPIVGEMTVFNASVSVDPDGGDVVNATWDFGDGAVVEGITATHAYSSSGFFSLHLVVIDDEGQAGDSEAFIGVSKAEAQVVDAFPESRVLDLRASSTQTLHASLINTGERALSVYVAFAVTSRRGTSSVLYSMVAGVDVRGEVQLAVDYSPQLGGRYWVTVTVFFNPRSSLLPDPHWQLESRAEFYFNVVGRISGLS